MITNNLHKLRGCFRIILKHHTSLTTNDLWTCCLQGLDKMTPMPYTFSTYTSTKNKKNKRRYKYVDTQ